MLSKAAILLKMKLEVRGARMTYTRAGYRYTYTHQVEPFLQGLVVAQVKV